MADHDDPRATRWYEFRARMIREHASGGCLHVSADSFGTLLAAAFDAGMEAERAARPSVPEEGPEALREALARCAETLDMAAAFAEETQRIHYDAGFFPGERTAHLVKGACRESEKVARAALAVPESALTIPISDPKRNAAASGAGSGYLAHGATGPVQEPLVEGNQGVPGPQAGSGGQGPASLARASAPASREAPPSPGTTEVAEIEGLAREVGKCSCCDGEGVWHMPCPCDACGWGEGPCGGPGPSDTNCDDCEGKGIHPKAAALLSAVARLSERLAAAEEETEHADAEASDLRAEVVALKRDEQAWRESAEAAVARLSRNEGTGADRARMIAAVERAHARETYPNHMRDLADAADALRALDAASPPPPTPEATR
jgi:hypothetical protein